MAYASGRGERKTNGQMPKAREKFGQGSEPSSVYQSSSFTEIHEKTSVSVNEFIPADRASVAVLGGVWFRSLFFNT